MTTVRCGRLRMMMEKVGLELISQQDHHHHIWLRVKLKPNYRLQCKLILPFFKFIAQFLFLLFLSILFGVRVYLTFKAKHKKLFKFNNTFIFKSILMGQIMYMECKQRSLYSNLKRHVVYEKCIYFLFLHNFVFLRKLKNALKDTLL